MKKLLTPRVIILLLFVLFALVAIRPSPWMSGLSIRAVQENSSASIADIENPDAMAQPLARERVLEVKGIPVNSVEDYYSVIDGIKPNMTFHIKTNQRTYTLLSKPEIELIILNQTKNLTVNEIINNRTVNVTKEVALTKEVVSGTQDPGLTVTKAPFSNIRKGLDLTGGSRVVLKPVAEVDQDTLDLITESLRERLNVFGLTDINIRQASDLGGTQFVVVEVAEATEEEVRELLSKQGKFEASVAGDVVFSGGDKDITYVCRSASCSGIDVQRGCGQTEEGWFCPFFFQISLSAQAAQRHADITAPLQVVSENGQSYLNESLVMYLDDKEVTQLRIQASLRGRIVSSVQITGGSSGRTYQEAVNNALGEMKRLQTVIISGSLPVQLEIVRMDAISPALGKEFLSNAVLIGFAALLAVSCVIYLRYRTMNIVIPMVLALISEIIILLGFASLIRWNLDLAALAGIIITVGTGVDHLIIITDEVIKKGESYSRKRKLKNAMSIVMGAFFTTVVGMIPLWFAGAGLLRGFAFITIAGLAFGVLIARPAYGKVIEMLQ